jgi:predicted small metal-binding protein
MATQTTTTKASNKTPRATARTAWQYACTDSDGRFSDCGYLLRNHDRKELARMSSTHAKDSHKMDVPADYFESTAKQVGF